MAVAVVVVVVIGILLGVQSLEDSHVCHSVILA